MNCLALICRERTHPELPSPDFQPDTVLPDVPYVEDGGTTAKSMMAGNLSQHRAHVKRISDISL
jgi:hypothetical protein